MCESKLNSGSDIMAIAKKPCINDATFSYTGKEMSPLGLGYSANAEKVGHFMKGKDNTMWMVGMKNGVKVWVRVPSEMANTPLQKEEPVLQEQPVAADEAGPSEAPPAPKKKAAPRKKTTKEPPVEEVARELLPELEEVIVETPVDEPKEITVAHEELVEEKSAKEKAPVKKKAAPRKKTPEPKEKEEKEENDEKNTKKTRKPTDFNLFMKYRMMHMDKEIKHKDKFQMAAKEWKQLDADAKKEIMEKVHAEFST